MPGMYTLCFRSVLIVSYASVLPDINEISTSLLQQILFQIHLDFISFLHNTELLHVRYNMGKHLKTAVKLWILEL